MYSTYAPLEPFFQSCIMPIPSKVTSMQGSITKLAFRTREIWPWPPQTEMATVTSSMHRRGIRTSIASSVVIFCGLLGLHRVHRKTGSETRHHYRRIHRRSLFTITVARLRTSQYKREVVHAASRASSLSDCHSSHTLVPSGASWTWLGLLAQAARSEPRPDMARRKRFSSHGA